MTLEADLDRGVRAERLLANPLLIESFDMVRTAIIESWEAAPMRDKDGAHELKLMLKLLTDVRANLEQAVTDGKLAAAELKTQRRELSPAQWRAEVRK
jgi:hypothetical protein